MYSYLFELAKKPEKLGIYDEYFNDCTQSRDYDFTIVLSDADRESAIYIKIEPTASTTLLKILM